MIRMAAQENADILLSSCFAPHVLLQQNMRGRSKERNVGFCANNLLVPMLLLERRYLEM